MRDCIAAIAHSRLWRGRSEILETAAPQANEAEARRCVKAARNRRVSALDKGTEVARLAHELAEAREQQVATSEILRAISAAPTDVQAMFETYLNW